MERIPWYVEAQRGKYFDWAEEDPAYINYKRKQEQAKEYSRLADCLDSSRILADSGLIAGDGSSDWSPAALQSGLAEASSALEREGKQALTAGEEGSHGKTEGGGQEEDAEGGEEAGSFASGFSMGTTAGLNPVSYTHLDVYKRQLQSRSREQRYFSVQDRKAQEYMRSTRKAWIRQLKSWETRLRS